MTRDSRSDHAALRRVPIRLADTINRSGAGPSARTGQQVVSVSVAASVANSAGVAADTTRRPTTRQIDSSPFTYVTTVSPTCNRSRWRKCRSRCAEMIAFPASPGSGRRQVAGSCFYGSARRSPVAAARRRGPGPWCAGATWSGTDPRPWRAARAWWRCSSACRRWTP